MTYQSFNFRTVYREEDLTPTTFKLRAVWEDAQMLQAPRQGEHP